VIGERGHCHPERSEAESKDPAAVRKSNTTGFLDFARNDIANPRLNDVTM
jgi:hypothetical protein